MVSFLTPPIMERNSNMKLKKITALLLAGSMIFSLVACGGTGTNGDSNKDGDNSSQWAHLDWEAGADASGGDVELRVTTWRVYDQPYYEEIAKRFEEKYDWIDIKLEFTTESSYYSNLQADIMNGTEPDVMDLNSGHVKDYAKEGVLAPQTDFAYMDSYLDTVKKLTTIDDENYAFMLAYNYFGFMYNMDVFTDLGLSVPSTPQELVNVVNELKKAGYGGISYPGATVGSKIVKNIIGSSVGVEGYKELYGGIDNGSVTDMTTVDGVKEAYETVDMYLENDVFYNAFEGIGYDAATSLFAQKKAAILYGGTYTLGEAESKYPELNIGYFPIPTLKETGLSSAEGAQCASISAKCENLGAAKLWVEFMATPEIASYFCDNSKMISSIEGVEYTNDIAKMIQNSSTGFVMMSGSFGHESYWQGAEDTVRSNVFFNGADWKKELENLARKLEDYDLSSL